MNPNMPSSGRVDVLATIRRHAESHRAMAEMYAYSKQEAPRLEAAYSAIEDLIEAADVARVMLNSQGMSLPSLDSALAALTEPQA